MVEPATRNLTIVLTDIKGFTDKTSHQSRAQITALLDEHRAVVLPVLEARGGRLIKTIGDAYMLTFDSPTNAVLAGVDVQKALARRNEGRAADDRIEIRIGVNTGEVNLIDGDVYGEAVNITARVESVAEAGQVFFTEAVFLAMNKAEVPALEIGLASLKGIPQKVRVYKVGEALLPRGAAPSRRAPADSEKAAFDSAGRALLPRRAAALALDLALCVLLTGGYVAVATKIVRTPRLVARKASPAPPAPNPGIGIGDQFLHNLQDAFKGGPKKRAAPAFVVVYDEAPVRPWRSAAGVLAALWFAYNLALLRLRGATLGKLALGLKVVALDGAPPSGRQRFLRALVAVPSAAALFLGYLWAVWGPRSRGWPDLAAGTRVIRADA